MPERDGEGWDGRGIVMIRLQGIVIADFGHKDREYLNGHRSRVFGVGGDGVVHGAI